MRLHSASSLLVAATLLCASRAMASEDSTLAEALFEDGKRLMAAGDFAAACPKLAESHRIDPGGGTVLTLALCLEKDGKTASSWTAFREALSFALRDHDVDRQTVARAHSEALEPKLIRLIVHVANGASDTPGFVVLRDGAAFPEAARDVAAPVDPGEHVIEAKAPGKTSWSTRVRALHSGDVLRVEVPVLGPLSVPSAVAVPAQPRADSQAKGDRATLAILSAGVAVASAVSAALLGSSAVSRESDVRARCPSTPCASSIAKDENDLARTRADLSTGLFALAAASAGLSAYFFVTQPSASSAPTTSYFLGARGRF